jgi:outer membrane protein assembly factor BamB
MRRAGYNRNLSFSACVRAGLTFVVVLLNACGSTPDTIIVEPPPPAPVFWNATIKTNGAVAEAAGRVAVPNRGDFTVSALDPFTGQAQWTRTLPTGTSDFGSFADLFVAYKAASPDSTAATFIDPVTGYDVWSLPVSALQPRLLMRVGSKIIAQINDTLLVALDRTSGQQAWRVRLGPLTCTTPANCGTLRAVGVDRGDGYLVRQSSVEAQVITVRETGVVSQIVAQSAVMRRVMSSDEMTAVQGTGVIAVASRGDVAGIDAATGAERWRSTFISFVPSTYAPEPVRPKFIADGSLLVALMADSTTAREVIVDLKTGQLSRQRVIPREQFTKFSSRCGEDGYAYLNDTGFEYVALRTGAVTNVVRQGFAAALAAAGLTNSLATSNGYIVFSTEFSVGGRHIGVKCAP